MSLCWFCFYFAGGHLTNRCVFLLGGRGYFFSFSLKSSLGLTLLKYMGMYSICFIKLI